MTNLKLEELVKRYQPILTDSIEELKKVPDFIEKKYPELTGKNKRVKISTLQETIIANKDKNINHTENENNTALYNGQHGDLKDSVMNIRIDLKISYEYLWSSISKESIEMFNPNKASNYFYLTVGLDSRSAVFIQHTYLKQLIDENKITYKPGSNFIGVNEIKKLINASNSLYDPNKIIEFKF